MSVFDDVDEEILRCYHEITLANLIFYGLKEGACSEQSARMTAMDSASKNASKGLVCCIIMLPNFLKDSSLHHVCRISKKIGI